MREVGDPALPCPSPEDYAALPLYMQRLAETTEAEALAIQNDINASLRPPAAIWRTRVLDGPIASGSFSQFFLGSAEELFRNYLLPSGGLPQFGQGNQIFPSSGIYHLTWSATFQNVGANTANSYRQMSVIVYRLVATGFELIADLSQNSPENEAIEALTTMANGGVFAVPDPTNTFIIASWAHSNAASQVQIPIGGFTAALVRVGGIDVIEVA